MAQPVTSDDSSVDSNAPLLTSQPAAQNSTSESSGSTSNGTGPIPPPREPFLAEMPATLAPEPSATAIVTAPTIFPWNLRLERDYGKGDVVQYTATYPTLLAPYLSEDEFGAVVGHVNDRLLDLDRPTTASVVEGLLSWVTLGLSDLWRGKPTFWKELDTLRDWVAERSREWAVKGLSITDPKDTAWQFVSIWIVRAVFEVPEHRSSACVRLSDLFLTISTSSCLLQLEITVLRPPVSE